MTKAPERWPKVSAIVLAAGRSLRMGPENKLLLPYQGTTVLGRYLDMLAPLNVYEIIVVLGHEAERLRPFLSDRQLNIVENPNYIAGMTGSIQAGVAAAAADTQGLMICLADQVKLCTADLQALIACFANSSGSAIIIPQNQRQRGNPVLFHASYRAEILAMTESEGCKPLIKRHETAVQLHQTEARGYFQDLDTPEDYQSLI